MLAFNAGYTGNGNGALGRITITELPNGGELKFNGANVSVGQVISSGELNSGALTFKPTADFNGDATFSYTAVSADGISAGGAKEVSVSLAAVNDIPTATASTGTAAFTSGGAAVVVDGAISFTDIDSTDFANGQLVARISVNNVGTDLLAVRNEGAGAGKISVSGSNISYHDGTSANVIGTFTGGSGTAALTITLGTNATAAAVQALARNITYDNTNASANTLNDPVVSFVLNDGDGGTSVAVTRTVDIVGGGVNPNIGTSTGESGFLPGDGGITIDPGLLIVDQQGTFNSGFLTVSIGGVTDANDRLLIENQGTSDGQISIAGSNISYTNSGATTLIGTLDGTANGSSGQDLTINLNAAATNAAVQALGRAVQYNNVDSAPLSDDRVLSFSARDADGNLSSVATRTVSIDQTSETFSTSAPTQQVLTFDGTNDHLSLGNAATLINGGATTWEGWINTSQTTGTQTILGMGELTSATVANNVTQTLTSGTATNQSGEYKIDPTGDAENGHYFTTSFNATIGDGFGAGEGFSFNYGVDNNPLETGVATGLAITFDTDASGNDVMEVKVDGVVLSTVSNAANFFRTDTDSYIDLGGTGDALNMGSGSGDELLISDNLTVEAWVNPDELSAEGDTFISIGGLGGDETSAENIMFRARIEADGSIEVLHESNSGNDRIVTWANAGITAGEWQHVAITRDVSSGTGGEYTLYVNGVSKGIETYGSAGSIDDPTGGSNGILMIGGQQSPTGGVTSDYNGQMDDVRIWNGARTAGEISDNFQSELSGNHTDLVANYTFDGSSVGADTAGNASDGTATGTVTQIYGEPIAKDNNATAVPVTITYDSDGLDVVYNGTTLVSDLNLGTAYNPASGHEFILGAQNLTGADQHVISNLTINAAPAGSTNALVIENGNLVFKSVTATGVSTSETSTTDSGTAVADGQWHKVSMTHDGDNTLKLYVDGALVITQTGVTKEMFAGDAFIGKSSTAASDFFNGSIGEISVWDAVLTAEQINLGLNPNIANPGTATNLVGYWNMSDDLAGGVVTDTSANSNDATLGAATGASSDDPTAATTSQAVVSAADWAVVEGTASEGGDSVLVQGGEAAITNRELLRSTDQFDPTAGNPIHLTGRFTFTDASDFFHVMTRAAGTGSATNDGLPLTGIEFKADLNGNSIGLQSYSNSATPTALIASGDAGIDLIVGAEYTFEVFDSGSGLSFSVSEVGNGDNAASITATSALDPTTNYVVITNRNGVNENHTLKVDDLQLNHGFITSEGTAMSGVLHAQTATGTLAYGTGLDANDAPSGTTITTTNGTFTITDTATGAFTYTPNAGYHGAETVTYLVKGSNGTLDSKSIRFNVQADTDVDVSGGALRFDGVNDVINLGTTGIATSADAFTYEMWINTSDTSAGMHALLNVGDALGNNSSLFQIAGGKLAILGEVGGTSTTLSATETIADGQWHHVAVTYDGAGYGRLYTDGVQVAEGAINANPVSGVATLGATASNASFYNGQMDEVRAWNVERSADDIRLNYDQQMTGSESGLVSYYRFDQIVDGVVIDSSASNNSSSLGSATDTGDSAEPSVLGAVSKVMKFDGVDDLITVADDASLNFGTSGSFTLEGWVNTTDTGSFQRVLIKPVGGGQSYSLAINNGKAHVRFDDGATSGGFSAESTASINDGTWHHIAGVFDNTGNTLKIFVDGQLATTTAVTTNPIQGTEALQIGGHPSATQYFNGQLDDIRIWNTARSDADIQENYQQTLSGTQSGALVAHYTFDDATASDAAGNNDGALTGGVSAVDGAADGKSPDIFGNIVQVNEGQSTSGQMVYNESLSGDITYHVLDGSSAEQSSFANGTAGTLSIDAETGHWTFVPADNFHGTATFTLRAKGATSGTDDEVITVTVKDDPENSIGNPGGIMQFDGGTDKVVSAGNITLTSHSMELWINTTDTAADKGYLGTDDTSGDVVQILSATGGTWKVELSDGTDTKTYISSKIINDGQWHHIAYTYDVSGTGVLKLYVDGVEDTSVTEQSDGDTSQFSLTDKLQIGVNADQDEYFEGQIDEVRVWGDLRTATEIQENYQNQISNPTTVDAATLKAYYRFDDESVAGKVQNLGADGDTLDADITGADVVNVLGRALNFDGSDDVLNIVDTNILDTTSFTIETWVQLDVATNTTIIARTDSGGISGGYSNALYVDGVGKLSSYVFNGAAQKLVGTVTAQTGQWYHVASVYDADTNTMKLYINGQLDAIKTGVAAIHTNFDRYQTGPAGNSGVASGKFDGQMAELRIWGTARTDAEVADNYNQIIDATQHSDLKVHYNFDETSGTVVDDATGAVDGALTGGANFVEVGPTIRGTEVTVQENQNAEGSMVANDISGTATFSVQTAATNGTVEIDANGIWHYTPKPNFHGTDTFTLKAAGSVFGDDQETFTVTVNDVAHKSVDVSQGALQFDGVDDEISVSGVDVANKSFSMEFWSQRESSTSFDIAIGQGASGTNTGLHIGWRATVGGISEFTFGFGGNDLDFTNDTTGVGEWIHWAVTYDVTTDIRKIYKDGDLVAQDVSALNANYTGSGTLSIGNSWVGSSQFQGMLDDVRIWDDLRTGAEIRDNFDQQLSGSEANLQAYYRFDDQSSPATVQNLGLLGDSADGTINNGGKVINLPSTAIKFDGSGDYIDAGRGTNNELAIATDLTIETWVKLNSAGEQTLIAFGADGESLATNYLYSVQVLAGGDIKYFHESGSGGADTALTFDTNLDTGMWYHISVVRDVSAKTVKLFVDGRMVDLQNYTNDAEGGSSDALNIGRNITGPSDHVEGAMADVRVWKTARTDAEIADNYNEVLTGDQGGALVLNYKFEDGPGHKVTDSAGANDGSIKGDAVYIDTGPDIFGSTVTVQENQSVSGSMSTNDVVRSVLDLSKPGSDVASGMTVGTFDGFPTTAISMEMWINPDDLSNDPAPISYSGGGSFNEFAVFITGATTLRIYINDDAVNLSGFDFAIGEWSHISVTWDSAATGDNLFVYQNGIVIDQANTSSSDMLTAGGTLYLGADQDPPGSSSTDTKFTNNQAYDGQMAEVRVWNDVRTEAEIAANYNKILTSTGDNLVANWQLNEASGSVAIDKTGNHNGTYLDNSTSLVSDLPGTPFLPLINDGALFSVTGAGAADGDGKVSVTTSNGGTVIVDQVSGEYSYTPAMNFYGTDTFVLTAKGDGTTGITDSETITVTVNQEDHKSVDVSGNVLSLDGTNDYVDIPDAALNNLSAGTIEAWVFLDANTGEMITALQKDGTGSYAGFSIGSYMSNTGTVVAGTAGKLYFQGAKDGASEAVSNGTISAGEWHHVAVSFDSSEARFYIDGSLDNIVSGDHSIENVTSPTNATIGSWLKDGVTELPFDGKMDDVRIWNDVRTAEEIRGNFDQQLSGTETNLNAYYRFDENTIGSEATDQSANAYNGTLTNGALLSTQSGNTLKFTNAGDHAEVTASGVLAFGTGDISMETWFKLDQVGANQALIDNRGASNLQGYLLGVSASNKLTVGFSDGTNASSVSIAGTDTLVAGTWYHAAVTFDRDGNATMYLNGEVTGTATSIAAESATVGSGAIQIGRESSASGTNFTQFKGEIADLRLWGDVRTSDEIKANYQTPPSPSADNLVAHYNFDDTSTTVVTNLASASNNGTITGAAKVNSTAPIEGPEITGSELSVVGGQVASGLMIADDISGTITFSTTGTAPANGAVTINADTGEWTYTPTAGFVGTNTFTLRASDGTRNDDEVITVTVTDNNQVNVHDGALQLDGSGDYIQVASNAALQLTNAITLEAWVNVSRKDTTGSSSSDQTIIAKGHHNYLLNIFGPDRNDTTDIRGAVEFGGIGDGGGAGGPGFLKGTTVIDDGAWHHVAATFDGTTMKLYIDGELDVSMASSTSFITTADALTIGRIADGSTNRDLNGQIDEVRVWSTARTATEISDNYNQQITGTIPTELQAYYRFDDQSEAAVVQNLGTLGDAADGSFVGNSEIVNAPDRALSFDGVDDVVTIANTANLDATAATWSIWIKSDGTWGSDNDDAGAGKGSAVVMGRASTGISENGLNLMLTNSGTVSLNAKDATTDAISLTGTTSLTDNKWHQITVSYNQANGSLQKVYVDGVLEVSGSASRAWAFSGQELTVGKSIDTFWEEYEGQVGDVHIYNRQLTDQEVSDGYNQTALPNASGLVGLYQFDETSGTTATNNATSANKTPDGTLAGDPARIEAAPDIYGTAVNIQEDDTASGLFEANGATAFAVQTAAANGTAVIDAATGLWTYQPIGNFYGTDTFTLRATGAETNTHDQTITVTVSREDHTSVNLNTSFAQFDGVNDYVVVADDSSLKITGDLTLEAWINPRGVGANTSFGGIIVGKDDAYLLGRYPDGSISFALDDGTATFEFINTGYVAPENTWVHIAIVFDADESTVYTYANGDLVATNTNENTVALIPSSINSNSDTLIIGGRENFGGQPFHGEIDEVRVWDAARTSEQIRENYDQQLDGTESNLQAYYRFDDDDDVTTVRDLTSNGNHGTLTNGADLIPNLDKALDLNGTSQYLTMADLNTNFGDMTVETWVNLDSLDGGNNMLLASDNAWSANDLHLQWDSTSGKLKWAENGGVVDVIFEHDFKQDLNEWQHVSVVKDASAQLLRLYLNGVLVESQAMEAFHSTNTIKLTSGRIGAYDPPALDRFLDGQLSDLRIWNTARTADEIQQNYNQTLSGAQNGSLVVNYVMDEIDPSSGKINDEAGSNSSATVNGGAEVISVAPDIYGNAVSIDEGETATGVMTNSDINGTATYSVSTEPTNGSVEIDATSGQWTYTAPENYAGSVTFDVRAKGATFGTDTETVTITIAANAENAIHGGAIQLDGVNDHVTVAHDSTLNTGTWTIESWFQTTAHTASGNDNIGRLISKAQGSGGNQYSLYMLQGNVYLATNTITTTTAASPLNTYNDGDWHHAAGVFDGTTLKLYIDGALVKTETNTNAALQPALDTKALEIGSYDGTQQHFEGTIDEVRIWSDARTAQEIADNYNEEIDPGAQGLTANYRFDDVKGDVVQNTASYTHSGGDPSAVLVLDGVDDYVTAALGDGTVTDTFTMATWVKQDARSSTMAVVMEISDVGNTSGFADEAAIQILEDGRLQVWLNSEIVSTAVVPLGEWTHLAVSYSGSSSRLRIYMNGEQVHTAIVEFAQTDPADPKLPFSFEATDTETLYIGRNDTADNYFHGQIDEVRVWSDVRSASEIGADMHNNVSGSGSNLVAAYSFETVAAGTPPTLVNDEGTASRNATPEGGARVVVNDNDGVISGSGSVGPSGNVIVFDGTGDYITLGNSGELNVTGAASFELWVRPDNLSGVHQSIWSNYEGGGYNMFIGSNNQFGFELGTGSGAKSLYAPNVTLATGQWYHIAGTYSGATPSVMTLYVDGVLQTTDNTTTGGNISHPGSHHLIGAQADDASSEAAASLFTGAVDNVRMWNSERTADEVREGMTQSYDYDTTDLLAQYTFDDVSGTTVRDNDGTQNNGTIRGDATITDSGSGDVQFINHLGNALRFDGNDDAVTFTGNAAPTGTAARTIMLWAKTSSDAEQMLVAYGDTGAGVGGSFQFGLNSWDTVGGGKGLSLDVAGGAITFQPHTATNDGQWHHYAIVVGATSSLRDVKVYQDGVLLQAITSLFTNSDTALATADIASSLVFGADLGGTTRELTGDMAEVSIWSSALTTAQVSDYMAKSLDGDEAGLVGYYKLDHEPGTTTAADSSANNNTGAVTGGVFVSNAPTIEGSSLEIAENTSASGQMTDTDVTGIATYTLIGSPQLGQVDLDATSGQWTYTPNDNIQGSDSFTIRATGATSGVDDETVSVDVGVDPVATTDYGLSLNPNNPNETTIWDNTNDAVTITDVENMGTTALSVEMWVKTTGTDEAFFSYANSAGDNAFLLYSVGDQIRIQVNDGAESINTGSTNIRDGQWHHIAATYDSSETDGTLSAKIYLDGAAVATTGTASTAAIVANGTIMLGQDQDVIGSVGAAPDATDAASAFSGEMNEVRVWDDVRDQAEIQANMDRQLNGDEAGLVGYWDFDAGSGAITIDQSGNGNDGVLTNGTTYKNLTTVTMGNAESYKGLILGEDVDGDNLSYAISDNSSLENFVLTDNTYSYDSHATNDGDNEVSIDITDEHGNVTTETLNFVVS